MPRGGRAAVAQLPSNVAVRFLPEVAHAQVASAYAARHVLVLPTLGENFGFVVLEALAGGRPVIVSDRTPWRGLQSAGVGWDLDLAAPERWAQVLQQCVDLSADRYDALCTNAARYAREAIDVQAIDAAFDAALIASARAAKLTV
jgi:glycosyltransferase involved in cell wall biosynthesis